MSFLYVIDDGSDISINDGVIARLMDAGHVFHAFVENKRQVNFQVPKEQRAFTENFDVPGIYAGTGLCENFF